MHVATHTIVPISFANQNFSKVTCLVDQYVSIVIMKLLSKQQIKIGNPKDYRQTKVFKKPTNV